MICILLHACNNVFCIIMILVTFIFSMCFISSFTNVLICTGIVAILLLMLRSIATFLYDPYKELFTQKSEIILFWLNTSVRRTTCIVSMYLCMYVSIDEYNFLINEFLQSYDAHLTYTNFKSNIHWLKIMIL